MEPRSEYLPDGWTWWRVADPTWRNPLDPGFAERRGGRWNPAGSFPTLYLNEDLPTARLNLRAFIARQPYNPEDLRSDTGPVVIGAGLPRRQPVCDVHTREGLRAVGLPDDYPVGRDGRLIGWEACQPIGQAVKDKGLRGVRARCAQVRDGAGRELAWYPASARSVASEVERLAFDEWFW